MENLDQTRSDHLRECEASDEFPEMQYIVYASLRDEANEGWAWLSLPDYPSRTLIEIRHGKRKVFCEYRKIDENFRKGYNDNPRTVKINSICKKCCALVLSAWYRDALDIKTSGQQRSDAADVETERGMQLQIRPLQLWGWRSLRVTSHHPDIVVRLATRLGVLGAWLAVTGTLAPITPSLLDKHRYTAMAICATQRGRPHMKPPKVYIDANVLKFSATRLPCFRPREQEIRWGGRLHKMTVYAPVDVNPNDLIKNPELKAEADLLPELADAGKRGELRYVMQFETRFESWGLPKMNSATGRFYGAPIEAGDAPIRYGRVIAGGLERPEDVQFEFLKRVSSKRFLELQKVTGAYQGKANPDRNQLLDAFHLWCAEHNKCEYFLTLDFKLIRMLERDRSSQLQVKAVRPSQLLRALKRSS